MRKKGILMNDSVLGMLLYKKRDHIITRKAYGTERLLWNLTKIVLDYLRFSSKISQI